MKEQPPSRLNDIYLDALQLYLSQDDEDNFEAAAKVGLQAVPLGLETLDMVKIHNEALTSLISPTWTNLKRGVMTARAALFFAEVLRPIEDTHATALKNNKELKNLNLILLQRTLDLADSKRELKEGVSQRKAAEKALKTSTCEATKLLEDSRQLQRHLKALSLQILAAGEEERRKMSLELENEIAQTLLSINVRLLTLDKEMIINNEEFEKEIATTQSVVRESVAAINRFVREFSMVYEN